MKFTQAQHQAIMHRDGDALISAGAGSGKTAVLSERVLSLLHEGLHLNEIIVLTFTKAAAHEMKERIRHKILHAVEMGTLDLQQARLVDSAHIQTFDSFALYIFQKFGHLEGRDPRVALVDPIVLEQQKTQLIDQLFEAHYQQEDPAFLALIESYALKDDRLVKQWVREFHHALDQHVDQASLIKHFTTTVFEAASVNDTMRQFEAMIDDLKEDAIAFFEHTVAHESDALVLTYFDAIRETLIEPLRLMRYEDYHQLAIGKVPYPIFNKTYKEGLDEETVERVKAFNEYFKNTVLKTFLTPASTPFDTWKTRHINKQAMLKPLLTLVQALGERLESWMHQHGRYTFQAIAKEALALVRQHDYVKTSLQHQFKEILVDEYQDTSNIQEALIQALDLPRRFMVGDIKQSIYRFRHADVTIFKDKQARYQDSQQGRLIALNDNFRSREEVIQDLNAMFEALFTPRFGGLAYDRTHTLQAGNKRFSLKAPQPYGLNVHRLSEAELKDQSFNKRSYEIVAMADHILARMKEEKTLDGETLRPLRFQDITILIDRRSHFDLFASIFEAKGIPLVLFRDESLINSELLEVLKHAIKVVVALQKDDPMAYEFKRHFYGLGRSFLWRLDDDTLIQALLTLESWPKDAWIEQLEDPLKGHLSTLFELAQRVAYEPLDQAFTRLIESLQVLAQLPALKDTKAQRARLDHLLLSTPNLAATGLNLEGFIDYLDDAQNAEIELPYSPLKDRGDDAVTLMTIHGSKGLQFPHLYIAHLDNPFKFPNANELHFDRELGFILPVEDEQLLAEDVSLLLKKHHERDAVVSETLRQWYVALTRAEESIHVWLWDRKKSPVSIKEAQSYGDFLRLLSYRLKETHELINAASVPESTYTSTVRRSLPKLSSLMKTYREPLTSPPLKAASRFSMQALNLLPKATLDSMRYGEELHQWLERIDFKNNPLNQLDQLHLEPAIKTKLETFFTQPLWSEIEIVEVYQEYAFVDESDALTRQGYIDCLIETQQTMIVIDYKLKTIDKQAYTDQVQGYMDVVKRQFNKPVKGYLYSLIEGRFQAVEER